MDLQVSHCPLGSPCSHTTSTAPYNLSSGSLDTVLPRDVLIITNFPHLNSSSNSSHGEDNGTNAANSTGSSGPLLPTELQVSLIALFSLTVIFSIVGNVLVVIVFTNGRRCRTDIRPFLINLAIADLIMAVFCMSFTFTFVFIRHWIFSAPMCPIVLFMQHLSVSASVFTNMAIGIDRFLVVTFPLRARMTSQRAKYTIAVIWICALGLSSVQLVVGRTTDLPDGTCLCGERWGSQEASRTFTIFIILITYAIPLVILAVTYSIVCVLLWKRTAPGNAHHGRDLQQLKAKRKVIKMLVLVVIMFGVCWLPLHVFFLMMDYHPEIFANQTEAMKRMSTIIYYMVFWLAMSNSCANPIVYGFTNDSFRADLAALCYRWFPFCLCLKKLANRQFSGSTCDSVYNRRFNSTRNAKRPRSANNTLYKQAAIRNGSKVYIERQRERGRTVATMNDFYKDASCNSNCNGRSRQNLYKNNQNHTYPKLAHHHENLCKTDSNDSTRPLTLKMNNGDVSSDNASSPLSETTSQFSNAAQLLNSMDSPCRYDDTESDTYVKLHPLPEISSEFDNSCDYDSFQTEPCSSRRDNVH